MFYKIKLRFNKNYNILKNENNAWIGWVVKNSTYVKLVIDY